MEFHKRKLFLMISLMVCCQLNDVSANQVTKPAKCPGISALKDIHIQERDVIEKERGRWACCTANGFPYYVDGKWSVRDYIGNYDTNDKWSVSLHDVTANNAAEALDKVNQERMSLFSWSGPHYYMGRWSCSYQSQEGDSTAWLLN